MTDGAGARTFFRLVGTEAVARGISAAQSGSWLAGLVLGAWTGSVAAAVATWLVTQLAGLAVIVALRAWVWSVRDAPPRRDHDAALLLAAVASLLAAPVLSVAATAAQSWVFANTSASSLLGAASSAWMATAFLAGLADWLVLAAFLALAWSEARAPGP